MILKANLKKVTAVIFSSFLFSIFAYGSDEQLDPGALSSLRSPRMELNFEEARSLLWTADDNYKLAKQGKKSPQDIENLLTTNIKSLNTCKRIFENIGEGAFLFTESALTLLVQSHFCLAEQFEKEANNLIVARREQMAAKKERSFVDSYGIIDKLEAVIKHHHESYQLHCLTKIHKKSKSDRSFLDNSYLNALEFLINSHIDDTFLCNELNQTVQSGKSNLEKASVLKSISDITLKRIAFLRAHFIDSSAFDLNGPVMQQRIEALCKQTKGVIIQDKSNKRRLDTIARMEEAQKHLFQPICFHYLLWDIYCQTIKSRANIMNTLALNCLVPMEKQVQDLFFFKQMFPDTEKVPEDICATYLVFSMMSAPGFKMANLYFTSRNECLSAAVQAYREHLYQGEYSETPEKEEAFIAARLEDLAGNPLPLKDFYRALHQERKRKAEQKTLSLMKAQQEENRKREKERARQKAQKEAEIQERRNNKSAAINDENEIRLDHTVTKPEKYTIVELNVKKKTKGTPTTQSKKVETISKNEEKKTNLIILSRENYRVFQALVGESLDRKVTLGDVKSLLGKGLKCTLTPGGNGIHQKAKAPEGGSWTMPGEWGHPIPDYYRQQLCDFLQNTMGIDPSEVKSSLKTSCLTT